MIFFLSNDPFVGIAATVFMALYFVLYFLASFTSLSDPALRNVGPISTIDLLWWLNLGGNILLVLVILGKGYFNPHQDAVDHKPSPPAAQALSPRSELLPLPAVLPYNQMT